MRKEQFAPEIRAAACKMSSNDNIKRLSRGAGLTTLIQGAKAILGLASIALLGRLVTPENYGRFAIATTVVGIAAVIKDSGIFAASLRVKDDVAYEKSTLHWTSVVLGAVSALAVVAASPLIAWAFSDGNLKPVLVCMSMVLLLGGFTTQYQAHLHQEQMYKKISLIDFYAALASALAGISAAASGAGIYALVVMAVTQSALGYLLSRSNSTWRPVFAFRIAGVHKAARFGGQVSAVKLLYTATASLDTLLLGKVSGMHELGAYGRAQTVALLPVNYVVVPLQNIFLEWFGSPRTTSHSKRWALLGTLFAFSFVSSTFAGTIFVAADAVIGILMGPNWQLSVEILMLLVGCVVFIPMNYIGVTLLTASTNATGLIRWSIASNILIAGSVLAGIHWGAKGLALAHSITCIFLSLPLLLNAIAKAWQLTKTPIYLLVLWPIFCSAVAAGVVVLVRGRPHLPMNTAFAVCATVAILTILTISLRTPRRFFFALLFSAHNLLRSKLITDRQSPEQNTV